MGGGDGGWSAACDTSYHHAPLAGGMQLPGELLPQPPQPGVEGQD